MNKLIEVIRNIMSDDIGDGEALDSIAVALDYYEAAYNQGYKDSKERIVTLETAIRRLLGTADDQVTDGELLDMIMGELDRPHNEADACTGTGTS